MIWLFYLAALAGCFYGAHRWLFSLTAPRWRLVCSVLLGLTLLAPTAVPDTQQLAPAWLVALFELALGRPESSFRAVEAIALLFALAAVLYFLLLILARRR